MVKKLESFIELNHSQIIFTFDHPSNNEENTKSKKIFPKNLATNFSCLFY